MNCGCTGSNQNSTVKSDRAADCGAHSQRQAARAQSPTFLAPVDVYETGDAVVVVADVPGARPSDVDATFEDGVLTIGARVEERTPVAGSEAVLREYRVGDFRRTIRVGHEVDAERINASITSGVLTVTLPKSPAAQARKIRVSGN